MERMMMRACQSCGMPMGTADDFGTEADGTLSGDCCTYCYQNGAFTEPDLTREDAVSRSAPLMASIPGMPSGKAEVMVRQYLSTLGRWRTSR